MACWRARGTECTYTGPFEGGQGPGERSSDPTGNCPGLSCKCPGVSSGGMGQRWPAERLGALNVHAWDLLKEAAIISVTSTIVWLRVNNSKGTQPYPSTENWIDDLLNMAPRIRTRPNFPLSQSLPSESFHKPLTLLHQRADRLKPTIIGN